VKEERLQVRIDPKLKEQAARLARRRHTTVSALVTHLLQQVVEADRLERQTGSGGDVEQI